LILECSQGCYGRTDGSVTISLRNFVGEGIIKTTMYIEMREGSIRSMTFNCHCKSMESWVGCMNENFSLL
jgi:hypothetical protein